MSWKEDTIPGPLKNAYVTHFSKTILNGNFVQYELTPNIYHVPQNHQGFNEDDGVFIAPVSGSYLISVMALSGKFSDLSIKFTNESISSEPSIFKLLPQPENIENWFQKEEGVNYDTVSRDEVFIYNLLRTTSDDTYKLQCFRRISKENKKRMLERRWREKKGSSNYFHFPQHSEIRKIREANSTALLDVPTEAFEKGNLDLTSRLFNISEGTQISVTCALSDPQVEPKIVWALGLIKKSYGKYKLPMSITGRSYGCYRCGKSFETEVQLACHMKSKGYFPFEKVQKILTDEKNFISPLTGKKFKTEEDLKRHLNDVKHFRCDECPRRFANPARLEQHKELHKNLAETVKNRRNKQSYRRPGVCCVKENCGQIFADPKFIPQHHKQHPHFYCTECQKGFFKKPQLFRHMYDCHDKQIYYVSARKYLQDKLDKLSRPNPRNKTTVAESRVKKIDKIKKRIETLDLLITNKTLLVEKINSGSQLEKAKNSQSVINIIIPRELWGPIQSVRTRYIQDARCGPHFSFLDPFVVPRHYELAEEFLREELKTFEPFEVTLDDFDYFIHGKSCTLYLKPKTEPPNAIEKLLERCLKVFPQCNDTVLKGKSNGFQAHVTIAKFSTEEELQKEMKLLKSFWKSLKFPVKELYFLSRTKGLPFEVKHVIPLGPIVTSPFFGEIAGIPNYKNENLDRCAVLCDILPGTNEQIIKGGVRVAQKIEVLRNPDDSMRDFAVCEFLSDSAMKTAITNIPTFWVFQAERSSKNFSDPFWVPLRNLTYPALGPQDCCSLSVTNSVSKQFWFDSLEEYLKSNPSYANLLKVSK